MKNDFRNQIRGRIPAGQRVTEEWPVLHYGTVPNLDPSKWRLKIFGLVGNEKVLNLEEFMKLPQKKFFLDIHCVTGWSRLDNEWEGVSTSELKNLVKLKPEAGFVTVHAEFGFTTNLSVDDFFHPDALLAHSHGGKPLTPEHGYPVRLVVPHLYFWKSAKWVNGIEFTDKNIPGFWESQGYHMRGDPWKEERYAD